MDKVCCNCKHNIRDKDRDGRITCRCEIDNSYIGYVQCMEYKCKHWSKEKQTLAYADQSGMEFADMPTV